MLCYCAGMKKALFILTLLLAACDGNNTANTAPGPGKAEAKEIVRSYLKLHNECHGVLEIQSLEVEKIEPEGNNWKVMAEYTGSCHAKNSAEEHIVAEYHAPDFYVIYLKSDGAGWYKAYMPDGLDNKVKKVLDKIRTK